MPLAEDLLARVERVCAASHPAKALREQILAVLRRAVPFDGHVFMLTDPVTRIATSPLADVPALPWNRLPELIRWRYLTQVNRWDRLLDARTASASLLAATGGDREKSLMWRHVQRDLGIVDTALVPFADRNGCWGVLDLWRTSNPFTAGDVASLADVRSVTTRGLRAAVARTFVDQGGQFTPIGPAVVVLDPDLRVRTQTEGAAATLLQLNPPDEPMAPIPAAAYNIGAALIAHEEGVPIGPVWSRLHLGGSRWVTVRASRLGDGDIAVSIEPSTTAERMDLFARAHGLSVRESQVLTMLGTGLDSRAMAERAFLSVHTVNDHVKAVLAKSGARTRHELLSRISGGPPLR